MPEIKDTGIGWIGKIPIDWDIIKIGGIYSLRNTKVSDRDYPPLSVTMKGILPQLETSAKTNDHDNRKLVKKGDFAINSRSDRRGSCGISDYDGSVSLINTVLKPNMKVVNRYYNWLFHTTEFADEFYKWGHGIVDDLWTTNWQDMKKMSVPYPSVEKQEAIATFLDVQCSEIDALHADIEKQIGLLEQYKKSVITEAVTKGLDPYVEMKDSGIEWIGKIPKDWVLSRLKFYLQEPMKYGASETGVEYSDGLYRYIRITDIDSNGNLKNDGKLSLTPSQAFGYVLRNDTVLFARSGGTVGKSFMYKLSYGPSAFAGYLISAVTNIFKLHPKWLLYFTNTSVYWEWVNRIFTQATIQNIGADKYSNMPIVIAPIDKQESIIAYLDSKCAEIDSAIADKKKQLEILEAYKKSLIYEYVTGKKEVSV